jgi:cysteinyl-tRNA synthetase
MPGYGTQGMRLWDTAFREVREMEPRDPGKVSLYVCGPTPYADPHAGHARLILVYDILRRYLEWRGLEVRHVSNITDIEDKIIARSAEEGISPEELVRRNEEAWFEMSDRLGALRPHEVPRATAYVEQMVEFIAGLVAADRAYETSDGVYFEVAKLADYGQLLHQPLESLKAGARVEVVEDKRAAHDFALWKKAKPGEPAWASPWGEGRPGWHIECTVMALDLLGDGFDLHGAGSDLIFPHNENERAQAVAGGRSFARHWLHNGMLNASGEKMSKSLGNVVSVDQLLDGRDPRALRLLVLRSHYRTPMEVSADSLDDATAALSRLDSLARRFDPAEADKEAVADFIARMEEDLDTPGATAVIFDTIRKANADQNPSLAAAAREMCQAVGLVLRAESDAVDEAARALAAERDQARAAKDWARADALRAELESQGWLVEDTPQGTQLRRGH